MKTSGNEIVLTYEKIYDNAKRFWWLAGLFVLIGVLVIFAGKSESEQDIYKADIVMYLRLTDTGKSDKTNEMSDFIESYDKKNFDDYNGVNLGTTLNLMQTKYFEESITQLMQEKGFVDYEFSSGQVETEIKGDRILLVSVHGYSVREVTTLVEVLVDASQKLTREVFDDVEITFLHNETEDICVTKEESQDGGSILSIRNIFIIVLSLLASLVAILICAILDKRFRNKQEVEGLENALLIGDIKCGKKQQEDIDQAVFLTKCCLLNKSVEKRAVISLNSAKVSPYLMETFLTNIKSGEENIDIQGIRDIEETYHDLKNISEVIFMVAINDDKIYEVQKIVNLLNVLRINIMGIIYVR